MELTPEPTPYDTGARLQPMPYHVLPENLGKPAWRDEELARYGRVDFDNEESATLATAYMEKTPDGYVLRVESSVDLVVDLKILK